MKTQDIAGVSISLDEGTRYIASIPMAEVRQGRHLVNIFMFTEDPPWYKTEPVLTFTNLGEDGSRALINEFNSRPGGLGRVW